MDEGKLPNLAKLRAAGTYRPLLPTTPSVAACKSAMIARVAVAPPMPTASKGPTLSPTTPAPSPLANNHFPAAHAVR